MIFFSFQRLEIYQRGRNRERIVEHADKIISLSIQACEKRTGLPANRFRPWLQVFKDYNFDLRIFDRDEVQKQIPASEKNGHRGWLLWNPASRYPRQYL